VVVAKRKKSGKGRQIPSADSYSRAQAGHKLATMKIY